MNTSGPGIFLDGRTSARQAVAVDVDETGILARDEEGQIVVRWRFDELQRLPAPAHLLRFAHRDQGVPARLEIRDAALAAAIDALIAPPGRPGDGRHRRAVVLSLAAAVVILAATLVGLPTIADRLSSLLPLAAEQKLGEAIDHQVRAMLERSPSGQPAECGGAAGEKPGRAALDAMVDRLAAAAGLPVAVSVVRRHDANALALPGGRIYVFEGLIGHAETPDELAAVIAHEIGHVAHHDGTRSVVRAAGLSLVFGVALGDFVGGSAVIIAARTLIQSAYSREIETAADSYSVALMQRLGGNPQALAGILERMSSGIEPAMKMLMDHPETRIRVAAIKAQAGAPGGTALLGVAEWAALKRICSATKVEP
ncbi:MAG TPA: M48 family metallopeptidase [Xanthobacteraceae bacterium]|nr:M48 family metallopeptidase [Xanthobacteraceae bacterium]